MIRDILIVLFVLEKEKSGLMWYQTALSRLWLSSLIVDWPVHDCFNIRRIDPGQKLISLIKL